MNLFQKIAAKWTKKLNVEFGEWLSVDLPREYDVKVGVDPDVKCVIRQNNEQNAITTGLNAEDIDMMIQKLTLYRHLTEAQRSEIINKKEESPKNKAARYYKQVEEEGDHIGFRIPKNEDYQKTYIDTVLCIEIRNKSKKMFIGISKDSLRNMTEQFIHYYHNLERQIQVLDEENDNEGDDSSPDLEIIPTDLAENEDHIGKIDPSNDEDDEEDEEEEDQTTQKKRKTTRSSSKPKKPLKPTITLDLAYRNQKQREAALNKLHYFS